MTQRKFWLIAMTLVAVVSDTMLVPFYPQFFERVFGITDPTYVGSYFAAFVGVVVLAFPVWARVARHINVLHLLIYTQLAAGTLSVLCWAAPTPLVFWVLSLSMMVFKASYLLVYPMLMSEEKPDAHGRTIGLLSVVVHFGAIFGAVQGGAILEWLEPRQVYLFMALSDIFQIVVCMVLLRRKPDEPVSEPQHEDQTPDSSRPLPWNQLARLGSLMFLFYFSSFLIRPFFVRFWEKMSNTSNDLMSGLVFAIPGAVAVAILCWDFVRGNERNPLMSAFWISAAGLFLQAVGDPTFILAGRLIYGWGLYRAMVGMDQRLYAMSHPNHYAADFSKVSFFQKVGVLTASYASGVLVEQFGLVPTFLIAGTGVLVTLALCPWLSRAKSPVTPIVSPQPRSES